MVSQSVFSLVVFGETKTDNVCGIMYLCFRLLFFMQFWSMRMKIAWFYNKNKFNIDT